jgi:drug/metabolite transporter (DMT)-like permease
MHFFQDPHHKAVGLMLAASVLWSTGGIRFLGGIFEAEIHAARYHCRCRGIPRHFSFTAVAAVFLGISLSFFDHISPGHLAGNCVALLSGVFCAAMYVICGEADMESRVSGIFLSQLLTAAIGIPFAAFDPPKVTLTAVLSLIALGVFQIGISYIFYAMALRDCPPLACSLIGAAEPLLNPLWVFVFNGEAPGVFPLVGGGVVILSVTGWCVWRDRFLAAQQ